VPKNLLDLLTSIFCKLYQNKEHSFFKNHLAGFPTLVVFQPRLIALMKQLHMVFEELQKAAILEELVMRLAPSVGVHSKLIDFVITISAQLNLKLELGLDCEHFGY